MVLSGLLLTSDMVLSGLLIVAQEAKNTLRATPKGLETPKYQVSGFVDGVPFLGKPELIELRKYEAFTVARRSMDSATGGALFGGAAGADGFNALASFLFGGNAESESMAMTMPVEITSNGADGNGASMAFVLPAKNAATPPTPKAGSDVQIAAVPERMVAAKPFPGIVTDEEVERQRAALVEALQQDGRVVPVDAAQVSVLQYNGPFTIPWRRRNEVALVVTPAADEEEAPLAAVEAEEAAVMSEVEEATVEGPQTAAEEEAAAKAKWLAARGPLAVPPLE